MRPLYLVSRFEMSMSLMPAAVRLAQGCLIEMARMESCGVCLNLFINAKTDISMCKDNDSADKKQVI